MPNLPGANEPFEQIIQRTQFCEKHGLDSILIDDHPLYGTEVAAAPEPFTIRAAVAAETRRIRVRIAVTVSPEDTRPSLPRPDWP